MRFILWGALHGVALAIHKWVMGLIPSCKAAGAEMPVWRRIIGICLTFHVVCFGWILFRATSMQHVGEMLSQIVTQFHPEVFPQFVWGYKGVFSLMLIGYIIHFLPRGWENRLRQMVSDSPVLVQAFFLAAAIYLVVQLKSAGVQPFIYFQF